MYLNCHSHFSLRYGTLSPTQLVEKAAQWQIPTLALTDINNTSCSGEFVTACQRHGIKPVLGIDFRTPEGRQLFVGLARNNAGWQQLNHFLSSHALQQQPLPPVAPSLPDCWIIYPRLVKPIEQFHDNEVLGIRPEHVARLFNHNLLRYPHKLVALHPVTFLDDEGYTLHQLLRAIAANTLLSKVDPKLLAKKNDRLLPPAAIAAYYRQYPQLLHNTQCLLDTCRAELPRGLGINRQTFTGSKSGDFALLEKLAHNGAAKRYGSDHTAAAARVRHELQVIRNLDFCAYFLITWDIVRYAESAGYYHVGRGSGANSMVAYCLGITDVDPLELDLYFERFINPYRAAPPDFDIDFSWDERDDVTDYIFKRYGRDHTALLATYSTFQTRAVIRELGKVYGLPKADIDQIAALRTPDPAIHPLAPQLFHYAERLDGCPNYLSIHAGGIIISEAPLYTHTALQLMPKGFPIAHFDMHHAEDLGFHKFDVLSQRGLGHIKDAIELIRQHRQRSINIHQITAIKQDEAVKALLRRGDCSGCFYIESPAMRNLLQKLRCDNYVHLVAASSIIRPGVARSGMMKAYIERFHQPHGFAYLHPVFAQHLAETFGIMVYQEDVMKIVHHFAGLDLDESDVLRRVMTGKKHHNDTLLQLKKKYDDNCQARGYPPELSATVWRQIESFSGYSFCKAHSASFAVESLQSLYLRAHYPLEFMVAVINNFGGFYSTEYYVREAQRLGGTVHAPCVNHSQYLTTLEGSDIYLGLVHLRQFERQAAHRIVAQRAQGGPFRSLEDFLHRLDLPSSQVELLIRIGAFRFTGRSKYALMWEKNAVQSPGHYAQGELFPSPDAQLDLDALPEGPDDQALAEWELLGFPLGSPFNLLAAPEALAGSGSAADLPQYQGRRVQMLGYYVCHKDLRTSKGDRMAFGTWIDRHHQPFDTVHFPNFLQRQPFRGPGIYRIEGVVAADFGVCSIEVTGLERLPLRGWAD